MYCKLRATVNWGGVAKECYLCLCSVRFSFVERFVIGVAYDLGLANITAKYRQYGSSASISLNYEWRTNARFLTVGWNF